MRSYVVTDQTGEVVYSMFTECDAGSGDTLLLLVTADGTTEVSRLPPVDALKFGVQWEPFRVKEGAP